MHGAWRLSKLIAGPTPMVCGLCPVALDTGQSGRMLSVRESV